MSNPPNETAEAGAIRLAKQIEAKVMATLEPLDREMRIMKWPDEYRTIMWEAVARSAMNRAAASS